jgi:hypothetical protein
MPRELSRQEFDAIAARIAQSAPANLSREQFDDLVAAEAMKASGYEAPLTRERRAPGAPSGLDAGHHPESLTSDRVGARERFGKRIPSINELGPDDYPSDAAFLKRAPEVGMVVGGTVGGPLGSGVGVGAGRLVKSQYDQGAHLPSKGEVAGAAGEGLLTTAIGSGARMAQVAARVGGPVIANNARGISRGTSALLSNAASVAAGNPLMGMGLGAATKALTGPRVVKAVGNLATRAGNSPIVEAGADWLGRGGRALAPGADAYRQALLDALADDSPASAVP